MPDRPTTSPAELVGSSHASASSVAHLTTTPQLSGHSEGEGSASGHLTTSPQLSGHSAGHSSSFAVLSVVRTVDPSRLAAVHEVLGEAAAAQITAEQAAERIIVSAPELEALVRNMQTMKDPMWWVPTLLAIVLQVVTQKNDHLSQGDLRGLERSVERAIEQASPPQPSPIPNVTVRQPDPQKPAESKRTHERRAKHKPKRAGSSPRQGERP